MASIGKDNGGRKRILFVAPDKKRKTIRLGRTSQRAAEAIKARVEALVGSALSGCAWDADLARWVSKLDDPLADKLFAVGLIPKRKGRTAMQTLGGFLHAYIEGRAKLKPNTVRNYETTKKHLIDYFTAQRELSTITSGDCERWREDLLSTRSTATVARETKRARQYFQAAVRSRLIAENPFVGLPPLQTSTKDRKRYITPEVIEKVLDACPDTQWRLIIALSRYGGLRCPSETLALKWEDVNWGLGRVTVRSPKTEHHAGGETRVIPLFPELRPDLEAAFEEAEPGTEYVITRYRHANSNLRTQLLRIIKLAGVKPWPKPFHNLRASRETELTAQHPLHVVCEWIGNSATIANKHYLQVTDDHYKAALSTAHSAIESAAQNAAQ